MSEIQPILLLPELLKRRPITSIQVNSFDDSWGKRGEVAIGVLVQFVHGTSMNQYNLQVDNWDETIREVIEKYLKKNPPETAT